MRKILKPLAVVLILFHQSLVAVADDRVVRTEVRDAGGSFRTVYPVVVEPRNNGTAVIRPFVENDRGHVRLANSGAGVGMSWGIRGSSFGPSASLAMIVGPAGSNYCRDRGNPLGGLNCEGNGLILQGEVGALGSRLGVGYARTASVAGTVLQFGVGAQASLLYMYPVAWTGRTGLWSGEADSLYVGGEFSATALLNFTIGLYYRVAGLESADAQDWMLRLGGGWGF